MKFLSALIFFPLLIPYRGGKCEMQLPHGYKDDTTYLESKYSGKNLEIFDSSSFSRSVELLADPGFRKGAWLLAAPEGRREVECILDFGYAPAGVSPVWEIAQWSSKHSLSETNAVVDKNGSRSYANSAKRIAIHPDNGFTLEINGYTEYGDTPRKDGEPWPHLYISQPVFSREEARIPLSDCKHIYFTLDGKREFCRNYMGSRFDPRLHTAHVVLTLTVQVQQPDSPLHGKYLNVQIPVYDYRYDFPPAVFTMDKGKPTTTGMFIYGAAGDKVWDGTFKDGKWHSARLDILPILGAAVAEWTREDGDFAGIEKDNLYIGSFIMGWECEGTFHACMSFRNLSLRAVRL